MAHVAMSASTSTIPARPPSSPSTSLKHALVDPLSELPSQKRPKGLSHSSALHNSEGQFSRQQNTPQTSDQVQSIGGAATVNHVAAFTQSSPSAVSDKGHFNLEIPTATNPENGKRTATCPLEGCHRTYEGPNSKRICRSHITEFHQLRRPRSQKRETARLSPQLKIPKTVKTEPLQVGPELTSIKHPFKDQQDAPLASTSKQASHPPQNVTSHSMNTTQASSVASASSPTPSSQLSNSPDSPEYGSFPTEDELSRSLTAEGFDQSAIAEHLNLELAQRIHPDTGLPYCICPWPGCGKQYDGTNARSICRRHVANIHKVALSKQPRKSRWDSDRPQTEEERRLRTLNSKRKWAQKNRARKKEEAERDAQEAATNAALELASMAGAPSNQSTPKSGGAVGKTAVKQEEDGPYTQATVGQLLAPPLSENRSPEQDDRNSATSELTSDASQQKGHAEPYLSGESPSKPQLFNAREEPKLFPIYDGPVTQTPKPFVPPATDEQAAEALLDFMSSPTKPSDAGESSHASKPSTASKHYAKVESPEEEAEYPESTQATPNFTPLRRPSVAGVPS